MDREKTDDITFKLLANPTKLKKKNKKEIVTEDDVLFLKLKKRYPEMLILNSDKHTILNKIETLLNQNSEYEINKDNIDNISGIFYNNSTYYNSFLSLATGRSSCSLYLDTVLLATSYPF